MISVCVTTYNGEKYISEQLKSILIQLSEVDEVIISDDGSTDNTLNIIDSLNDNRIKIFHHSKDNNFSDYSFYKITRNFEYAISNAKGDVIFLADQDDIWVEGKVVKVLSLLKDKLLVLHDCKIIDDNEVELNSSYFNVNKSQKGLIRNIINSSYLGCCMAFKRELLEIALPFPVKPVPHDIWLGLIAESKNAVIFSDEKLLLYRRHDENMSTSGEKSRFSMNMKIKYRLILVSEFLKRFF